MGGGGNFVRENYEQVRLESFTQNITDVEIIHQKVNPHQALQIIIMYRCPRAIMPGLRGALTLRLFLQ